MSKANVSTERNLPEIDGRQYTVSREGVARCPLPPGCKVSKNAHVMVLHPNGAKRKAGWRVEIIFLQVVGIVACIVAAVGLLCQ